MSAGYRPDIDGLRAVAVGSVVLYHANGMAPGGYVGVDVFFVISGFLITRLITQEVAAGNFSFLRFYERRIRRLLPALAICLAGTTLGALAILMPTDLASFGRSLAAAVLLAANYAVWDRSGYFATAAELNPLLHLWSLAIEEQFYLVLPAFLALMGKRWPRLVLPILIVAGIASLGYAQHLVANGNSKAFFLLQYRAWELLAGAVLARASGLTAWLQAGPRGLVEGMAFAGAAAILGSIVLYSGQTPFPGLAAVPPCLGAGLVILAGEARQTAVSRVLSLAPLVSLGKASYGFYLFHWPPLALAKYYLMRALTMGEAMAILLAALVASLLSLRYVEMPYRYGRAGTPAWGRYRTALACAGVLGATAGTLIVSGGWPGRLSPAALRLEQHAAADLSVPFRTGRCFMLVEHAPSAFAAATCLARRPGRLAIALWGDSLAAHYYPGLAANFPDADIVQLTASSCPPMLDYPKRFPANCRAMNEAFFQHIAGMRPGIVVLSARWGQHLDMLDHLDRTIGRLKALGVRIVLLGPSPQYTAPMPRILARAAQHGRLAGMDLRTFLDEEVRQADRVLSRRYRARTDIDFVPVLDLLCEGGCPALVDGEPVSSDQSHLTAAGSRAIVARLRARIEAARRSPPQ